MKVGNLTEYKILDIKRNNKEYSDLQDDKRFTSLCAFGHLLGAATMTGLGAFLVKLANDYKQAGGASLLVFEPAVLAALAIAVYESIMDFKDIREINNRQKYIIQEELNNRETKRLNYDYVIDNGNHLSRI